jgi:hypothetical protein
MDLAQVGGPLVGCQAVRDTVMSLVVAQKWRNLMARVATESPYRETLLFLYIHIVKAYFIKKTNIISIYFEVRELRTQDMCNRIWSLIFTLPKFKPLTPH